MGSLVTGALAVPQRVVYDPPLHIDDGHGVPPLYFRDERSDGYHFVLDREAFRSATVSQQGAYRSASRMTAAAATGLGGPKWKARYAAAGDKPEFGLTVERAFQILVEDEVQRSTAAIAWLHRLAPGVDDATVYAGLHARGRFVRTVFDDAGKATRHVGVTFPFGFDTACATAKTVDISFDRSRRLSRVADSGTYRKCF